LTGLTSVDSASAATLGEHGDMSDESSDATAAPLTVIGGLLQRGHRLLMREPSVEALAAVEELFPVDHDASEFLRGFVSLTVLSSLIATFGLLADSSAVVIGAMLVAPLMAPILAASAAVVRAENRRLMWSLAVIGVGTVVAIAVAWVVSAVASQSLGDVLELPTEVRSRTLPDLLDLGVAVSAGAAAGYVLPRRSALSALPGVGIAVALVPPLASAGIALQLGLIDEVKGALLLYGTNLAAIVFAAAGMLIFTGFRPVRRARRSLFNRLVVTGALVVLVTIPLTLHTRSVYEHDELRSFVVGAIPDWDDTVEATSVRVEIVDGVAQVELQVVGPNDPLPTWRLAQAISDRFGGPVELVVKYDQIRQFEVSTR
jgi:uncharacterized hydrophobic protein (TIGR00271 family)